MKISVIGASKGTGALVVRRAIDAGHEVAALSRSGTSPSPQATAVAGDTRKSADVRRAIDGADAVIITLGAPGRDRSQLRTQGTKAVIDAMRQAGVQRVVALSSLGVGDSASALPFLTKRVVVPLLLRPAFDDHEGQERLLADSGLQWSLLRPSYLSDRGIRTGKAIRLSDGVPAAKVSREAVADLLLELATQPGPCGALAVAAS